jgi:hypothetical protein
VLQDTFVYGVCGLRQGFTFPDGFPPDAASHAYTAARGGYELRAAEFAWLEEDGLSEMIEDLVGHVMRTQGMSLRSLCAASRLLTLDWHIGPPGCPRPAALSPKRKSPTSRRRDESSREHRFPSGRSRLAQSGSHLFRRHLHGRVSGVCGVWWHCRSVVGSR